MSNYKIVNVRPEHIDKGIERYEGVADSYLNNLLSKADLHYTAYRFRDGRILLVLPGKIGAFLYESEAHLFDELELG